MENCFTSSYLLILECIPLVGLVMEQAATVKTFVKAGRKPKEVISLLKNACIWMQYPLCQLSLPAQSIGTHISFDKHFDSRSLLHHQSHQVYALQNQ